MSRYLKNTSSSDDEAAKAYAAELQPLGEEPSDVMDVIELTDRELFESDRNSFLAGIHYARTQSAAEIAEYREALKKIAEWDVEDPIGRTAVSTARDVLAKYPRSG